MGAALPVRGPGAGAGGARGARGAGGAGRCGAGGAGNHVDVAARWWQQRRCHIDVAGVRRAALLRRASIGNFETVEEFTDNTRSVRFRMGQ